MLIRLRSGRQIQEVISRRTFACRSAAQFPQSCLKPAGPKPASDTSANGAKGAAASLPVVYPRKGYAYSSAASAGNMPFTGELTFATGNNNKLKEVVAILESGHPLPFTVKAMDIDLPELQGEAEEIAAEKCRMAAERVGGAVMVEDTSLCFNAYKGLPGPYVKWFLKAVGPEGLVKMLEGFEDKSAYAMCIFAYTPGPGVQPMLFVGTTDGKVVPPRGSTHFGWDPVFLPDGFDETYAEMDMAVKNGISHRYRALDKLRAYLLGDDEA